MIRSLAVRLQISPTGEVSLPHLLDVPPGEYHAVLVIETAAPAPPQRLPLLLPVIDVGAWNPDLSLSRADFYDDES
ncbi:MAG: hypothetical protein H7Y11_04450 [Armatimonadetes bacterium]|nr:hypothetical protein [Anaerolineae bacterium]